MEGLRAEKRAESSLRHFWAGILGTLLLGGQASALESRASADENGAAIAPLHSGWSFIGGGEPPWGTAPRLTDSRGLVAPGFALGVQRADVMRPGDALSFTMSRPERNVPFSAIWILGVDPERSARDLKLAQSDRLVPTAREFTLRGAYRTRFGDWVGGFSLGYSFNAEQVAGRDALRTTLSLTRSF